MHRILGDQKKNENIWNEIKNSLLKQAQYRPTYEIAETFFNSICRKVFSNIGADENLMFVTSPEARSSVRSSRPIYDRYEPGSQLAQILKNILNAYDWGASFENLDRDIDQIIHRMETDLFTDGNGSEDAEIDMLHSVFFRNKAAYLVGRIHVGRRTYPFILPLCT